MKRRTFVIKSALASAALGTTSAVLAKRTSFMGANDTLNIGVIGTGSRGSGLIPYLNEIENIEIIACCDILPFRLEEGLSAVSGKAKGYTEYRKMLENPDIDAVLIATPFNSHVKIAMDAIDAGKHVYCEKTIAKGYEGIQHLTAKVKGSKMIFQNGHQYRSSKLYQHVIDMIGKGKIGTITSLECQFNRNGDWRRPVPQPEFERLINWRMYREFSGGLVAELCAHQIDVANWVLGATPKKVTGFGGIDYWKDGRETYDNIHLLFNYPNGVKASFTALTSNALNNYKTKILGDKGTIILDYSQAWFHPEGSYKKEMGNVDGVAGATLPWVEGKGIPIDIGQEDPSKEALINFRNHIVNNTEPHANVVAGAKVAICVQMSLDAMRQEKIVPWNSSLNL